MYAVHDPTTNTDLTPRIVDKPLLERRIPVYVEFCGSCLFNGGKCGKQLKTSQTGNGFSDVIVRQV